MPYNDGIPKINSYSLTDFHDFDDCPFRFFVRHHLDRKYEIDEGNESSALGNLLDQSIKKFHKAQYYGCQPEDLLGVVRASARDIKEAVQIANDKGKKHFYEATVPYLTEELITEATNIFQNYYVLKNKKINKSIEEVGFCEWVLRIEMDSELAGSSGQDFKLWGGPDALEMGEDGTPEVVDYKSRKNLEKGKTYMDMDLMPKIYTLLVTKKLMGKGFKKARFKVKYWQDPKDETFFEEFDLAQMDGAEFVFRQKIQRVLQTKNFRPCGRDFCAACKSEKKDEFLSELEKMGFKVISGEEFMDKS